MDILRTLRQSEGVQSLVNRSGPLLLAVSGGPDSTAMLHMFAKLVERGELSGKLYAGHVQHDLREGTGPADDRRFVGSVADQLDVPFLARSVAVKPVLASDTVSPEEAARRKRYDALHDMCREIGSTTLLTAHHQDDQVETVLLRLMNGTGIQGLRGIRTQRTLRAVGESDETTQDEPIQLVRPLLSISKKTILEYLNHNELSWRTDPSNKQLKYRRNFVREKLVPVIRKHLGTAFPDLLLQISRRASRLDRRLRDRWDEFDVAWEWSEGHLRIQRDQLENLSQMLFPYFLRWVKRRLSMKKSGLRYHDFKRLKTLLSTGETGREEILSDGICIRLEHSFVVVDAPGTTNRAPPGIKSLSLPGRVSWGSYTVTTTSVDNVSELLKETRSNEWNEVIDVSKCIGPLSITSRRQGDVIRPIGFSGHKKVTDLMIDEKIPASRRDSWPIVRDRRGIVWVPGLRMAHRVRITDHTRPKHVFQFHACRK